MSLTRRGFVGALIGLGAAPSLILPASANSEQRIQVATVVGGGNLYSIVVHGSGIGNAAEEWSICRPSGHPLWRGSMHPCNWEHFVCSWGQELVFTAKFPLIVLAPSASRIDVRWMDFDGRPQARSTRDGTILLQ